MSEPPKLSKPKSPRDRPQIDEAAQDWFLLLTSGRATAADQARFQGWLEADPRHREAYRELCDLWGEIEPLGEAFARDTPMAPSGGSAGRGDAPPHGRRTPAPVDGGARIGRRRLLTGTLAAGAAACAVVALDLPTALRADHVTGVGEQARVDLPDGSTAWLNTDTALSVAYDRSGRRIRLLHGEALFAVAEETGRPFTVRAREGSSTALGTRFAVHDDGDGATVTVGAGTVEVASPAGDAPAADGVATATLGAGQQVRYRAGEAPGRVRPVDPAKVLAWRRGFIALDEVPLPEALTEIERYLPGRIVLLAETGGLEPVTARLSIDKAARGLEALAATHGLQVTWLTPYLAVVR
jgi:transmembrane sensor